MIEFAFCMIILFLMMFGIVMAFRWVGLDLGQRQQAHQALLEADIDPNYGQCLAVNGDCLGFDPDSGVCASFNNDCVDFRDVTRGPLTQIDPFFYTPESMNAVWDGN